MTLQCNHIKRDLTEGDSHRTEGDSSDFTLDNRDSAVQPIRRDCTEGDSSDFILDEQGTLFFKGRLVVPKTHNQEMTPDILKESHEIHCGCHSNHID